MARLREVLFEFHQVGDYVKVSAVDPVTLTEVSIVGSAHVGQHELERIAANKLRYVLEKEDRRKSLQAPRGLKV